MSHRIQVLLLGLVVAAVPFGCSKPAVPPPSVPSGSNPPSAASQPTDETVNQPVVARLFGKPVYRADCLSKSAGIGFAEVGLGRLIGLVAGHEYCRAEKIDVTSDELKAKLERLNVAMHRKFADSQAALVTVDEQLAAPDISPERKQALQNRKQRLTFPNPDAIPPFDAQKIQDQLHTLQGRLTDEKLPWLERMVLEGEERAARVQLEHRSWYAGELDQELQNEKSSRSLYDRFGGKVVGVQPVGMSPVEAMRDLVKEYEREGQIEILNETFRQAYWKSLEEFLLRPGVSSDQIDFTAPLLLLTESPVSQDAQAVP